MTIFQTFAGIFSDLSMTTGVGCGADGMASSVSDSDSGSGISTAGIGEGRADTGGGGICCKINAIETFYKLFYILLCFWRIKMGITVRHPIIGKR